MRQWIEQLSLLRAERDLHGPVRSERAGRRPLGLRRGSSKLDGDPVGAAVEGDRQRGGSLVHL